MSTVTARGELIKPDGPEAADIDVINANSDKLSDYAVGDYICTSLTRPGAPWEGMRILETDTKARLLRLGGAWTPTEPIICTSATRPAGLLITGQQIIETDTGATGYWNGAAWVPTKLIHCTSGARPANPMTNQEIYETDTCYERWWDGATWQAHEVFGAVGINTDASGGNTFAHNLGRVPKVVEVTVIRPGSGSDVLTQIAKAHVWSVDAVNVLVRFNRVDSGAVLASAGTVAIYYRAR